jgi:hypothetical protein
MSAQLARQRFHSTSKMAGEFAARVRAKTLVRLLQILCTDKMRCCVCVKCMWYYRYCHGTSHTGSKILDFFFGAARGLKVLCMRPYAAGADTLICLGADALLNAL